MNERIGHDIRQGLLWQLQFPVHRDLSQDRVIILDHSLQDMLWVVHLHKRRPLTAVPIAAPRHGGSPAMPHWLDHSELVRLAHRVIGVQSRRRKCIEVIYELPFISAGPDLPSLIGHSLPLLCIRGLSLPLRLRL